MTDTEAYQRHLQRSRRFYKWAAGKDSKESKVSRLQDKQWEGAVTELGLAEGDRLLDFGCGTGSAFAILRGAIGESGHYVGIDESPDMLAAAENRIAQHGWDNVEVRRVDASTPAAEGVETEAYDAAIASMSLGAMPDVDAAVDNLYRALRPGGRAFVCDMAFGPNPGVRLIRWFYRRVMTGNGADVEAAVTRRFDRIEPITDPKGRKLAGPERPRNWPPTTYFVAHRAPAPDRASPADPTPAASDGPAPG